MNITETYQQDGKTVNVTDVDVYYLLDSRLYNVLNGMKIRKKQDFLILKQDPDGDYIINKRCVDDSVWKNVFRSEAMLGKTPYIIKNLLGTKKYKYIEYEL